ncbi:MAG: hypothetical protein ACYC4Q_05975 [Victivallaceae bacterium]
MQYLPHKLNNNNPRISGFAFCILLLMVVVFAGGCITEQEKRGYSDLPQNRPADWEDRPYGDLRN